MDVDAPPFGRAEVVDFAVFGVTQWGERGSDTMLVQNSPHSARHEPPWPGFPVTSSLWAAAADHPARERPAGDISLDGDCRFFRDAFVEAAREHGLAIYAHVCITTMSIRS